MLWERFWNWWTCCRRTITVKPSKIKPEFVQGPIQHRIVLTAMDYGRQHGGNRRFERTKSVRCLVQSFWKMSYDLGESFSTSVESGFQPNAVMNYHVTSAHFTRHVVLMGYRPIFGPVLTLNRISLGTVAFKLRTTTTAYLLDKKTTAEAG